MSNDYNPYAAPDPFGLQQPQPTHVQPPLADLGKRFLGAVIDGLLSMLLIIPGAIVLIIGIVSSSDDDFNPLILVGVLVMIVGWIVLMVWQIYLLATRSQTVGKYLMKTQLLDINTGQPAGLVNTLLLRSIVNGIICGLPFGIGGIYSIVDICFIFREDRRCVHDLLASTVVVDIS